MGWSAASTGRRPGSRAKATGCRVREDWWGPTRPLGKGRGARGGGGMVSWRCGVVSHAGVRRGGKRRVKLFRANAMRGRPCVGIRVRHQAVRRRVGKERRVEARWVGRGKLPGESITKGEGGSQSRLCAFQKNGFEKEKASGVNTDAVYLY